MTANPSDIDGGGCYSSRNSYYSEPSEAQVCDAYDETDCITTEPDLCEPVNDDPWCRKWSSVYKTYSMLLGEVDDNDFEGNLLATIFFILYMFGVVIVLANVLIAIVTDSYGVIKNERAGKKCFFLVLSVLCNRNDSFIVLFTLAVVFWSNRLDFVAEMDVIGTNVSNRLKRLTGSSEDDESSEGVSVSSKLGEVWKKFMYLFDDTDYHYTGISVEFILYNLLRFGIGFIVIPLWLIVGLAVFGILWPPQVREYLLTSSVTFQSEKREEEIARLERCEALKQDVSIFHEELKKEQSMSKDDIVNLRVLVSGARSELATEMKDVKRIVMELYENHLE
jgi:hypothetical protein